MNSLTWLLEDCDPALIDAALTEVEAAHPNLWVMWDSWPDRWLIHARTRTRYPVVLDIPAPGRTPTVTVEALKCGLVRLRPGSPGRLGPDRIVHTVHWTGPCTAGDVADWMLTHTGEIAAAAALAKRGVDKETVAFGPVESTTQIRWADRTLWTPPDWSGNAHDLHDAVCAEQERLYQAGQLVCANELTRWIID